MKDELQELGGCRFFSERVSGRKPEALSVHLVKIRCGSVKPGYADC